MGCSGDFSISVKEDKKIMPKQKESQLDYFKAYQSIKSQIFLYEKNKNNTISYKAFLISTKTIPNFMDLIEESQILKHILNLKDKNDSNIYEGKLKGFLKNYNLEKNIKIYYDYNECEKLIHLNDEDNKQKENEENEENEENKENKNKYKENEFIIVDEDFTKNMNINITKGMGVIIEIENKNRKIGRKILFNNKYLGFKQKKVGIYQFIEFVFETEVNFNPKDNNDENDDQVDQDIDHQFIPNANDQNNQNNQNNDDPFNPKA